MKLAVLLLAAAPALAECPTPDDLARGIRVEFQDGKVETFRAGGPGLVEVAGLSPDGGTYRYTLAHGVHILSFEALDADGRPDPERATTYDYGRPAADLPVPEPLGRFATGVTATDGAGPRSEPQSQAWGAPSTTILDGCAFDTIDGIVAYETANAYVEGLLYFPGLGLSVLAWEETADGGRVDYPIARLRAK